MLNNNINIVLKTLILGAHDNVSCAPELRHVNEPNKNLTKDRYSSKLTKNYNIVKTNRKKKEQTKIYIKNNREMVKFAPE